MGEAKVQTRAWLIILVGFSVVREAREAKMA